MSREEVRHLVKLCWAKEIFFRIGVVCSQRFGAGLEVGIEIDAFVAG